MISISTHGQQDTTIAGTSWKLNDTLNKFEFVDIQNQAPVIKSDIPLSLAEICFYEVLGIAIGKEQKGQNIIKGFKLHKVDDAMLFEMSFVDFESLLQHYRLNLELLAHFLSDYEPKGYYELDEMSLTIGQGRIWEFSADNLRDNVMVYIRFDSAPNHLELSKEWIQENGTLILRSYKL